MRTPRASAVRSLKTLRVACLVAALAATAAAEPHASAFASAGSEDSTGVSAYFPDLEGWAKDGEPALYEPETLYEYIDGAADIYISYGFRELASLYYVKGENEGIAVDVYRHDTPRNAFGIYSQERPSDGDFIDVGTQGYYETGMLNFLLGAYYVKLSGYSLGDEDETLLKSVAKDVASRLGDDPGLPPVLSAFPDSGKIQNSEKYVETNFMGHGFLSHAFTAEYRAVGRDLRVFIIEADDEGQAKTMVDGYVKLAKEKGQPVEIEGSSVRLRDPYQGKSGEVNLVTRGRYIWGMLTDDPALRDYYLKTTEEGLEKAGLL
jgi:hypothetical protein